MAGSAAPGIGRGLIVVGGYEASIRVELTGETYWAGHVHIVTAGANKEELKLALKIQSHYLTRPNAKPVTVAPLGCLGKRLGLFNEAGVSTLGCYVGNNGRQQRRQLPLNTREQIEFDQWLLGLSSGSRTILLGCRLHNGNLRETSQDF